MSVSFCGSVSVNAADPANIEIFFDSKTELPVINRFIGDRECPQIGVNPPSCDVNLSFGFFFDGINNNLNRDLPNRNYSNIARLYLAFPANDKAAPWPDVKSKYPHYFRTYVPGVGTK